MTTPPGKPEPVDLFGLPKLELHGGKDDVDNRDFSRAPINSGGTITGNSFQTSGVDPRVTIDSVALICHNAAGVATFTLDIATGNVTIVGGTITGATFQTSTSNPRVILDASGLRAIDAGGVVITQVDATAGLTLKATALGSTYVRWVGPTGVDAVTILGQEISSGIGFLSMFVPGATGGIVLQQGSGPFNQLILGSAVSGLYSLSNAGSGRTGVVDISPDGGNGAVGRARLNAGAAGMNLDAGTGQTSYINIADTTARLRIGIGALGASLPVDYINGSLVFQLASGRTCTVAGQFCVVGHRANTVTAGNAWGTHINWMHHRTDTAGAAVTPGSVTFGGAPSPNTNANTPQVRALQSAGGQFTINGTAAGITDYGNTVTVN